MVHDDKELPSLNTIIILKVVCYEEIILLKIILVESSVAVS